MSSHHYSQFSYNFKTKGKTKFQSYNTEVAHNKRNSFTKINNNKSYFKADIKKDYPRQKSKSPSSSYRRSTPSNQRNPDLKVKKLKSIQKYFKNSLSIDKNKKGPRYSPIKNERSKEKNNHKFYSSYYTNKKKDRKKMVKSPQNYKNKINQTISTISDNKSSFAKKYLSPQKSVPQTPQRNDVAHTIYSSKSKQSNKTNKTKVNQYQTVKPYSKYSRNVKNEKKDKRTESPYKDQTTSFNLNNSTTVLPSKCKYCSNYLIEQRVYQSPVPKEKLALFKNSTSILRSQSGKKSNLKKGKAMSPKKSIYDTYGEEVGKVETTIKSSRYNPNYYIDEFGTSVFKEPKKVSTIVEHYGQNKNKGKKVRYYNDAQVFGKKNNMAYYEIKQSPEKRVFSSPIKI